MRKKKKCNDERKQLGESTLLPLQPGRPVSAFAVILEDSTEMDLLHRNTSFTLAFFFFFKSTVISMYIKSFSSCLKYMKIYIYIVFYNLILVDNIYTIHSFL